MSGLLLRYLTLAAAVAMTGVTAFTVTPTPGRAAASLPGELAASPSITRPFATLRPPFVPGLPVENRTLTDRRAWAAATLVVEPEVKTATLVFGGDILVHNGVRSRASSGEGSFDFRPMFAEIAPLVSAADLAICHLEVPLTSTNTDLSSYPKFNAPHELAAGIASAGFDGCSTASNHSVDRGEAGLIDTLDILDRAGLKHAGTARSPEEAGSATMYDLGPLQVAHIAGTYWLNGLSTPKGKEWMAQRLDVQQILDMAGRSRRAGADLVVVSVHCCTEYRSNPTEAQVELFRKLIRSPFVDLVVGHHSHVVGPVDMVDGEYVVYGLGNLLSGQLHTVPTSEAYLAVATAAWDAGKWRIVDIDAAPTFVERGTYTVRQAAPDSGAYQRTMSTLSSYGIDVEPYSGS